MPRESASSTAARFLEYQRALAAFSRVASGALAPERLMQHACAQVSRVTHIKHTKVLQSRPKHGDLLIVAGVGWDEGVVGTVSLPADDASPAGRSVQTAAPVVIKDLANESEYRVSPLLRDEGIVSVLNVPIMIDGENWGVIEVDSEKRRDFEDGDVDFLTAFANIIGTAVARYRADQHALGIAQEKTKAEAIWKTLMREMQHRTKNNLQTIISFLSLQRRQADTPASRDSFTRVIERVHAIALAHDQLSLKEGIDHIEFGEYIRALCMNIDPRRDALNVVVDASVATMPLDRAVPAGLIVNELLTNAFKYAFDEGQEGVVRVVFEVDADTGQGCILVEDNGKGMGPVRKGGLGLTLINAFARQLGGHLECHEVKKGTRTSIRFPLVI